MEKTVLNEVYQFLFERNYTSSESEFSEHWLGKSEGYLRKLRSSGRAPSVGALAICASRLLNASEQFSRVPRRQALAQQLRQLSERCREIVDAEAVEFEFA